MEEEIEMIYGLSEGIEQMAIERTTEEVTIKHLKKLMINGNMTLTQAMDFLEIPEEKREPLNESFSS